MVGQLSAFNPRTKPTGVVATPTVTPVTPTVAPVTPTTTKPTGTVATTPTTESRSEQLLQQLIDLWTQRTAQNKQQSTDYLTKQRENEYRMLKQAYPTIKGDTWETAVGTDTVGQQNIQAFKDRWEKQFQDDSYDPYSYSNIYGGNANLGMSTFGFDEDTSPKSFLSMGTSQNNSGYIGG